MDAEKKKQMQNIKIGDVFRQKPTLISDEYAPKLVAFMLGIFFGLVM